MTYGFARWELNKKDEIKIQVAETIVLRWMRHGVLFGRVEL